MELSDTDDSMRRRSRKIAILGESARRQFESPRERSYGYMGELNYMQEDDIGLEATRSRLSNIFKKHGDLAERMSRDSDKTIFELLSKEFEAARALQTQEIYLEGEQWNDGLLATIRERVHMEVERKAMARDAGLLHSPHLQERITYRVGDKVICCLEGSRIGILYETSYAGEPCDIYHLVLECKSFLEKMTVLEHTIPFFLPLNEAGHDLLSSNAMRFIDYVGELLQAYVDRKEQVRLIKELYGNQIKELHCSMTFHLILFAIIDCGCQVMVKLKYADLVSVLPTNVSVVAWPIQIRRYSLNTSTTNILEGPTCLLYAEDALRTMSLPEAYAEIVLNLPQALREMHEESPPGHA